MSPNRDNRRFVLPALALAAGLGAVIAQTSAANPGPDLIIASIPDATAYGTAPGTGVYAFDLGTNSCNIGNVNIRWQASTAQHPVVAQNIYRLRSGRFEQVGGSWVKHGFFAATQNFCGTCNGQGGSVLGVGCSDPYDGGLNGDQAGLGPRSEINASTGAFPFVTPHPWPPVVDATSRRIQIAADDLSAALNTGAQYFGETTAVAADDAAAGNAFNNLSWRPVSFNTASPSYNITVTGTTHVAEPALAAWKAADASVRLGAIDIPGDGRFWLGHTATPNGNGTWHYEYALLNMNSGRGAGSFTVPIAPGTVITNAAFRGVPCHSGEPFSNDPWSVVVSPTAVTFAVPQSFVEAPNGPALRWATMCNFRFDASTAPGDGAAQAGLFKPGAGPFAAIGSATFSARTPGGATLAAPTPVNDMCNGALALAPGETRLSSWGATETAALDCSPISGDLWYSFTYTPSAPGCAGDVTITTCGSEIDTCLFVYHSGCAPTLPTPIACAGAGSVACAGSAPAASVTFTAIEGSSYLVRVGSPSGAQGHIVLNVAVPFCIAPMGACCAANGSCSITQGAPSCFTGTFAGSNTVCSPNPCPQQPAPANDTCAGATPIGDNAQSWPVIPGTNFQADLTVNAVCNFGASGTHDVWYHYRPSQTGTAVIDTCIVPASGQALDSLVSIHAGACDGPMIACNDDASAICPPASRIVTSLDAWTNYYIRVSGYSVAMGDFVVRVAGGGGKPVGACCWGSACVIVAPSACTGPNRSFAGLSVTCNPAFSNFTPCCRADFNQNGSVTIEDIFLYLGQWFQASPSATFGGNGQFAPIVQDIFSYLGAWFTGC